MTTRRKWILGLLGASVVLVLAGLMMNGHRPTGTTNTEAGCKTALAASLRDSVDTGADANTKAADDALIDRQCSGLPSGTKERLVYQVATEEFQQGPPILRPSPTD